MFLTLFVFLMKFADISKLHSQRCPRGDACNKTACWQHVARMQQQLQKYKSNSSSTSSGCDSNTSSTSSSKENSYTTPQSPSKITTAIRQQQQQQQQEKQQHHSITPQQLEELRYYQQLQTQHLIVLQQQLLQRRRFQQDWRSRPTQRRGIIAPPATTSATLTCNQQYLLQQRLQQQQQQQQFNNNYNNNINEEYYGLNDNDNDVLNNNNNNNNNINNIINNNNNNCNWNFGGYNYGGFVKGQKSRRGMTEFSTSNDISNKSHLSQPLQNSPRHHFHNQNFPQNYGKLNKHLIHANDQQQKNQIPHYDHHEHNNKNNQQTLPFNSSANISNINATSTTTSVVTPSPITSATHSPLHYRNPSNSPNNSPFTHAAYYGETQNQNQNQQQNNSKSPTTTATATTATTATHGTTHQRQYHQLQQHLRGGCGGSNRLPLLTQTQQYQQYLNDLLLQQHHLQQQQQQLLSSKHTGEDEELSEESLKQNVAIVLNNLDRYNNALRSIILNEQVTASSGVFFDENLLVNEDDDDSIIYNNNFLLSAVKTEGNNRMAAAAATPESDYNSNATTPGSARALDSNALQQQQNVVGGIVGNGGGGNNVGSGGGGGGVNGFCSLSNNVASNNLNCSLASSHDFTHDNSDYQWFLDYGYRDGCGGMQRSVLSSLSASYNGLGDLIYYEDLAKNLDANLAEVDMESFRAEDIHSLLSHLPSYCKSLGSGNSRLQQSLLLQQQQQQQQLMYPMMNQQHGHNISQTSTTSTNDYIDNSICKSELLFSPVKESNISVDSLDMDAYPDDGDIILTCKANKDNYTIAFEGSVLYSDDSFYEPNEISMKNKHNFINLHSNLEDIVKHKALEVSMSRSEQAFTPNNKLQKSNTTQLQRYPSGNNNTSESIAPIVCHAPYCLMRKSNSLPNLIDSQEQQIPSALTCAALQEQQLQYHQQQHQQQQHQQLNVSHAVSISTMLDCCKSRNLLPMCQIPISSCNSNTASTSERLNEQQKHQLQLQHQQQYQHQHPQQSTYRHKHRCCCSHSSAASNQSHNSSSTTTNTLQQQQLQQKNAHISGSASSGNSSNPPAFNLVKLFIKQKSSNCSTDDPIASVHTCMDVSSGCWPSSDAAGSSSSSSLEQRLRKKSMNDSGKGSALSRHEEEEDNSHVTHGDDSAFHLEGSGTAVATQNMDEMSHQKKCYTSALPSSEPIGTNSPAHRRRSIPLRHPQLCQLAVESAGSLQSSEGSRSNSEQITQIHVLSGSAKIAQQKTIRQQSSHASNSDMVTRSIQTSCGGSLSTRSSFNDRFRCVPPSFLANLNTLGAENQAPIYVIYPNYALPDLGFVKTHASSTDVIFSPFNYKMTVGSGSSTGSLASLKKRFSVNADEDEILKTMDFRHVVDWDSLATLLPAEYRKRLKHIPQVHNVMRQLGSEISQRPLFCMSPPIRRSRPNMCDCTQYMQHQQHQTQEEATSSSGSSQQPSSGYRGSSTLLTDESQIDSAAAVDPLKQMYVYQYEQQRMDSGVELSPAGKSAAPQPRPRGILRKSSSVTARVKRNSMIEEEEGKLTKLEKRRSLQEPPYPHTVASSEEHLHDVFEEEADLYALPQPRKERLSRKDLDARVRAENFLSSLPRSELKYYAEIAAILESSEGHVQYDAAALKKEVSRVLSQQKKVSFNDDDVDSVTQLQLQQQAHQNILLHDKRQQRFSTPPNSPIISMANGARAPSNNTTRKISNVIDEKEQRKIDCNRFKRLQIQWELMSKDSTMLKELANAQETKSGGSTPTSALAAQKSRIPRPVSYPAGRRATKCKSEPNISERSKESKICCVSPKIVTRINAQDANGKKTGTRSPSRIVPPKRYSIAAVPPGRIASAATTPSPTGGPKATTPTSATRARTPNSRVAVTAPNTPKRRVQSPRRTIPKVR